MQAMPQTTKSSNQMYFRCTSDVLQMQILIFQMSANIKAMNAITPLGKKFLSGDDPTTTTLLLCAM
jgi:hypothetical protein